MTHRRLNSVTKFDCFPLPRLDEAFDAFAGATVFYLLGLAMAYQHVPVKSADVEKTAVITHVGQFDMAKNAVRPLQCAVDISITYDERIARLNRPNLPCVFG